MKNGPIILVEDDPEDQYIFEDVLRELGITNQLLTFKICKDALEFLQQTREQPFIIFCDINLPVINGIEFKKLIDSDEQLRKKSIPFIFYSTSVNQFIVNEAYTKMTVQGFFQKKNSYADIRNNIRLIIEYWMECRHPNTA